MPTSASRQRGHVPAGLESSRATKSSYFFFGQASPQSTVVLPWPMALRSQGLAHFVCNCQVPFLQIATSVVVQASIFRACEHAAPMVTGSSGVHADTNERAKTAIAAPTRTLRE